MELKIQRLSANAVMPTRSYYSDAAFDLYATKDITLTTLLPTMVNTDIAMEIPVGFFGKIEDRSSMGKNGIRVLGGVIDASYRGPISVVLVYLVADREYTGRLEFGSSDGLSKTLKSASYTIKKGDRIAQIVIQPCALPELVEVDKLTPSDRGEGGFGSTGR